MQRKLKTLLPIFTVGIFTAPPIGYAETGTAQLDVEMGIAEAITFSCDTELSFGVTRIPLKGDSAGEITLAPDGELSSTGSDDFSLDDGAQVGECQLSGSVATENTEIIVSFPGGSAEMSGDTVLNLNAGGLSNPEVTLEASSETVDSNGEATIKIGGTLQLKEGELNNNDYGGYSVTMDVKIDI